MGSDTLPLARMTTRSDISVDTSDGRRSLATANADDQLLNENGCSIR